MGQMANTVRAKVEAGITARREELANELLERRMAADAVDVTLPGRTLSPGTQHLISQIREEIEDIFCGLGYTVEDGPYVETTYYNFTALNLRARVLLAQRQISVRSEPYPWCTEKETRRLEMRAQAEWLWIWIHIRRPWVVVPASAVIRYQIACFLPWAQTFTT